MIEDTLKLILSALDQALQTDAQGSAPVTVLSSLVDGAGSPVPETADVRSAFLVNIEREAIPARGLRRADAGDPDRIGLVRAPVHLNLMVMFAANSSGKAYGEALKRIERTILFFQASPVFTPQNLPGLDPAIDHLTMEIENLSITDLSNLWGVMGGRYVPSVLYRMRMITLDAQALESQPSRVVQTPVRIGPAPAQVA